MAKKKVEKKEEVIDEIEEVEEDVVLDEEEKKEEEYEPLSVEDRLLNVEKKLSAILILSIITVAICAITMIVMFGKDTDSNGTYNNNNNSEASSEVADDYSYDTSSFKEISAQDIASESKGKTIVVLIGRQGCGYCAAYAPIISKVAQANNVTIRYIDFLKIVDISAGTVIDSDAYNLIKNLDATSEWEKFGETALKGTPNTLFIKNSKIVYGINGYHEEADVVSAFKATGLSK